MVQLSHPFDYCVQNKLRRSGQRQRDGEKITAIVWRAAGGLDHGRSYREMDGRENDLEVEWTEPSDARDSG